MSAQRQTEPAPESFAERYRKQANTLAAIAGFFACFAEVTMFRRYFGVRYFQGFRTFGAFVLIPVFSLFWQGYDVRALYLLWLLFIVRCAFHRFEIRRGQRRIANVIGVEPVHSYYNGWPILLRRCPQMSEVAVKCKVEPAVMLGFGLCALTFSPPLGWFFIWCAVGMGVNAGLLDRHDRQQAQDLADAAIESEMLAARVRELRNRVPHVQRSRS